MSDRPLPPIDPELEALLEAERTTAPPFPTLDRVWARLERSTTPSPGGSSGGAARPALSTLAVTAVAAFALGAGSGVVWSTHGRPSAPERVIYVASPPPPSSPPPSLAPPPVAPAILSPTAPEVAALPTASARSHHAAADAGSGSSLRAERTILDAARRALAEDDAPRALALTEAHARRFAHPELAEEREAIAIEALVVAGRRDEARARAARFAAESPNSVFLPAVQASLSSIP